MRLDIYLYNSGFCKSRQKAKNLIDEGSVLVNGKLATKASQEIDESKEHDIIINDTCPYVSRGGLKLKAIIDAIKLDINGLNCIDIGASTGGFTDCLLQEGACKVFAVDTGENQLDSSLQEDDRVVYLENLNARNLTLEHIGQAVDIIVMDVSFISQTLIIPTIISLINKNGYFLSLIKPQFEVGRDKIGKGGIVKNKKHQRLAVEKVIDCAKEYGLKCNRIIKSPIAGGDGNIEYLAVFSKNGTEINENALKGLFT